MTQQAKQAILQLIESLLITALITGLISASAAISGNGNINWQLVGWLFGASFLFSLAHGVAAYFKALPGSQQEQLGMAIDALITALEKRYPSAPTSLTVTARPPTAPSPSTTPQVQVVPVPPTDTSQPPT